MMLLLRAIILALSLLCIIILAHYHGNDSRNSDLEMSGTQSMPGSSDVLSRKKRYLIYPEGSSFQMVFCLQYPMIIPIGDIFLVAITAALAWELPEKPYEKKELLDKMDNTKNIYYINKEDHNSVEHVRRKFIANPVFAKRSIPDIQQSLDSSTFLSARQEGTNVIKPLSEFETVNEYKDHLNMPNNKHGEIINEGSTKEMFLLKKCGVENKIPVKMMIDRDRMHLEQSGRDYLKSDSMSTSSLEFHRKDRKKLYGKLETLLRSLGFDGRTCVLKTLCEVGQSKLQSQGKFLEEIIRAVFSLPVGADFEDQKHRAYDDAHAGVGDCSSLYNKCDISLLDIPLK